METLKEAWRPSVPRQVLSSKSFDWEAPMGEKTRISEVAADLAGYERKAKRARHRE